MNSFKIFSLALAAILFASCDNGGEPTPPPPPTPDYGTYTGTVTVAPGTDNAFSLENIEVKFTVNQGQTSADIEMMKVKFASAMPVTLDVLIEGVTLTRTDPGYALSGDGIIPTAMHGQPFEQYIINDIEGTATARTLSIGMMCGQFPMSFTGTRAE